MNRILIIEDEKLNADRLKRLIKSIRPKYTVLEVLDSVADAVRWFENNTAPDLVMMDVRLSDGLSFEIFEKTRVDCSIVFTTAYDEYAVRAFKYDSIDYLLKPIESEELELSFEKLERLSSGEKKYKIDALTNFLKQKEYRSRFLVPFRDTYKTILIKDVSFFYSETKITRARLFSRTEEVMQLTMEELEAQLDPKYFFRANRQFIIHIDSIMQIHNYFNGKLKVELKDSPESDVIVSREKSAMLKSWLDY